MVDWYCRQNILIQDICHRDDTYLQADLLTKTHSDFLWLSCFRQMCSSLYCRSFDWRQSSFASLTSVFETELSALLQLQGSKIPTRKQRQRNVRWKPSIFVDSCAPMSPTQGSCLRNRAARKTQSLIRDHPSFSVDNNSVDSDSISGQKTRIDCNAKSIKFDTGLCSLVLM